MYELKDEMMKAVLFLNVGLPIDETVSLRALGAAGVHPKGD